MPARNVESNRAKAGARSAAAMEKTRNHSISNPSARKPETPARNMAIGSLIGDKPAAVRESEVGIEADASVLLLSFKEAVPPTMVLKLAANATAPAWPNSRIRNRAQK